MKLAANDAVSKRATLASSLGYLAFLLIVMCLLAPRVDHPADNMVVAASVCVGVAFGLALSGARFGKAGSRIAAWVALGLLASWLLIVLAASVARWDQVLRHWWH